MSLIRLEVHFLLLVTGFKTPACPMKVYDHQAAPGRMMLTNFDDLRRATNQLDKGSKSMRAKRKFTEDAILNSSRKSRKPLRSYGANRDQDQED